MLGRQRRIRPGGSFIAAAFPSIHLAVICIWLCSHSYANEIGPKILTFYEEYFGIEYPLPKQDMIAIPDFSAGAMENWGLVTYRDTALLYDPATSTAESKQRVATVIAHELAHQWFGNLG